MSSIGRAQFVEAIQFFDISHQAASALPKTKSALFCARCAKRPLQAWEFLGRYQENLRYMEYGSLPLRSSVPSVVKDFSRAHRKLFQHPISGFPRRPRSCYS